tara:strand:- start:149 stop:580 length:432 start_codon:yes stop_codon:yes gene_type:complete
MDAISIPKESIKTVWNLVENDITKALIRSGGYANSDYFKQQCLEGFFQLWIVWDSENKNKYFGVCVTEIIVRPLQRCLNIRIMTGRHRQKWQHLLKKIEVWAALNNCDKMELVARPGWERILKNFKYSKSHVLLEKPLKRGVN